MRPIANGLGSHDLKLAFDGSHPDDWPMPPPAHSYPAIPKEGDAEVGSVEAGQQGKERGPAEWETSRGRDAMSGPGIHGRAPPFGPYDRGEGDEPMDHPASYATDPPVSEAQRKAMYSAAEGRSTLGIPRSVGREFVGKSGDGWDDARSFLREQGLTEDEVGHCLKLAGARDEPPAFKGEPQTGGTMDRHSRLAADWSPRAMAGFASRYGSDAMRIKPLGATGTRVFIR
jgi:hypothetical protein